MAKRNKTPKFTGPTVEIPCPGEAHSNAYIDHCGICMPRWGVLVVPADSAAALAAEELAAKEEQERKALVNFQYRVSNARNKLERELREEAIKLFGPTLGNDIIF